MIMRLQYGMVMSKKSIFAILALLLTLLAGCDRPPKPPLVFGASVWPGYETIYLAQSQGYFPQQGLRLTDYGHNAEVMQAFRNHTIQAAGMTMDEALLLRREMPDLKIVLLFDASNGADVILAQPGITSMAQLRGKRVGVENTTLGVYFLSLALKQAGLGSRQISIVPLSLNEQEAAFREHKVDAVVTFDPVRARLLKMGAVPLFDSSRVPDKLLDVLVTRDEYIGEYHQELRQLVQGWARALDFLQQDRVKAIQLMAQREKVEPAQFEEALQGIKLLGLQRNREMILGDPPTATTSVDDLQRFMLNSGRLQVGQDASMLLDPTLLAEIKSDQQ